MKHFIAKSELGYKIFREREDGVKEWLQNGTYTIDKSFAKTFYHLSDATSALVAQKIKDKKGIEKPKEPPQKIKTTWSSS